MAASSPPFSRPELGTREMALWTLVNLEMALADIREVRRHVRGDHKRRLDEVAVILGVIGAEAKATYAIPDAEAAEFVRTNRVVRREGR